MTSSSTNLTVPYALARFRDAAHSSAELQLGLVAGDRIRPLGPDELGTPDLNAFLAQPDGWDRLTPLAATTDGEPWRPLDAVLLGAPVEPRQVLQTGANYRTHVIELVVSGLPADDPRSPEEAREWAGAMMDRRAREGMPYFFIGLPAAVVGDDVDLVLPGYSDRHDWEIELAAVIGREAYRVDREHALEHVAGYTIVNDVTTRDRVFRKDMKEIGTDWYRGKNAPGFLPTGPFLVPAPFVGDPGELRLTLTLNGESMQDASSSDLLFDVPTLIASASENMPLLPGDLVLTGSPAGNGAALGRFLRDGDVMVGAISGSGAHQGLGQQTVRCVAEPGA